MAVLQPLLCKVFRELGLPSDAKPEQLRVVAGILERDVFAVLPTGFGKSACYQCFPLLDDPSIVALVTPLTAIMKDQASLCCCHTLASYSYIYFYA